MEDNNLDFEKRMEELRLQSMAELDDMERRINEGEEQKSKIEKEIERKAFEVVENKRTNRHTSVIFVAALVLICSVSLLSVFIFRPMSKYNKAVKLLDGGQYDAAADRFAEISDYKDSAELIKESRYRKANSLLKAGKNGLALKQYYEIRDYKDSADKMHSLIGGGDGKLAVGAEHTVAVNAIGRVLAAGDNTYGQCNVSDWNNIRSAAAGSHHTLGLREDGTVAAVGDNSKGQCDVSGWRDIVYVAAAVNTSYGVKADGSVVAAGDNTKGQCILPADVFKDVKKVACGGEYVIALKNNGTVAVAGNASKFMSCAKWNGVADISAMGFTICALKKDGSVLISGDIINSDTSSWGKVRYVAAGDRFAVGITEDGSVVSTGNIPNAFKDCVRIQCGANHIAALQYNGSLTAVGKNQKGECNVSEWRDVMIK